MGDDEKTVRMAARLYECRDTARTLFGAEYEARVKGKRDLIRAAMAHHHIDAVAAALQLIKVTGMSDVSVIVLLAAAVDVVEE